MIRSTNRALCEKVYGKKQALQYHTNLIRHSRINIPKKGAVTLVYDTDNWDASIESSGVWIHADGYPRCASRRGFILSKVAWAVLALTVANLASKISKAHGCIHIHSKSLYTKAALAKLKARQQQQRARKGKT